MAKNYSISVLDKISSDKPKAIFEFKDGSVHLGILFNNEFFSNHYYLETLNINEDNIIINFFRSDIKRIIFFNGYVVPKDLSIKRFTELDIIELSELINKAGYEFI